MTEPNVIWTEYPDTVSENPSDGVILVGSIVRFVEGRPYETDNFKAIYYPGTFYDKTQAQATILRLIDKKYYGKQSNKKKSNPSPEGKS